MTKDKFEDKKRKLWLRKLRKRPEEEVEEYLDLAEFFILGNKKWKRDKEGKWMCFDKRLWFRGGSGQLMEPKPSKKIYSEQEDGLWVDKVSYKTISPKDAEELWVQIAMALYDHARDENGRLGEPLKSKKAPREKDEISWNEEAVASPQYKLVCEYGFRLYNEYVKKYEKEQKLGGLQRVEIYGSTRNVEIPGLDYDESTDLGDYIYKVLKDGTKIKEFLIADDHSDLDKRLRKMSKQERELTTYNPRHLLFGASRLTPKDQEDGWDLAESYRADLKTTLMTKAEIFEHLRREPMWENGKGNNNYKLHMLSFLLQALGMSHRAFVLLCSYFAGERIYFPSMPSITYEGRKRLVDYVLSGSAPTYILPEEEVTKLVDKGQVKQQLRLRRKVKDIIKASHDSTKDDEREKVLEKNIYDFIFTGKRKTRLKEEEVIAIFNDEVTYRIKKEAQQDIERFQTSDMEKQLAYNFASINKWLGIFKQFETGDDYSEYSQVKKALEQKQNPVYIGTKKAEEKEKEKKYAYTRMYKPEEGRETGMLISDWIELLNNSTKDTKRKLAVLRKMKKEQKSKAGEADDRVITHADLEILELEMWKEDIEKETDEMIKAWRERVQNGEQVTREVYAEFDKTEETYKKLESRSKIQVEEKQEFYKNGLETLFAKCKKLRNFIEETEKICCK